MKPKNTIKLNLLPPQEKEAIAVDRAHRWIIFYGSAILGILLIFIVLLGTIWLYLAIQLKTVSVNLNSSQAGLQGQDLKTQQDLIAQLNKDLVEMDVLQKNHKLYSKFLIALTELIPAGARLNGLDINDKEEVIMEGFAQRRDQVIFLKDSLEKSALFSNVESPLSNLVKQADINFYFKFNLRPDALIK